MKRSKKKVQRCSAISKQARGVRCRLKPHDKKILHKVWGPGQTTWEWR